MKDFPASSMVKNLPSNAGDASLLPGQETWEPTYLSTAAKRGPDTAMKTQCSENKTNKKYLKEWNDWGSTGGGDLVWGNSQDIMYLKDFKNP